MLSGDASRPDNSRLLQWTSDSTGLVILGFDGSIELISSTAQKLWTSSWEMRHPLVASQRACAKMAGTQFAMSPCGRFLFVEDAVHNMGEGLVQLSLGLACKFAFLGSILEVSSGNRHPGICGPSLGQRLGFHISAMGTPWSFMLPTSQVGSCRMQHLGVACL